MTGLNLVNVKFEYNENVESNVRAFKFKSLYVERGDIISIVGKSGSGKSTLVKLISGLLKPTDQESSITWMGNEISQPDSPVKIVFQEYSNTVFDLLTVKKNIWMGEKCKNNNIFFSYEQVLNKLNLDDIEFNLSSEISGGQKQRVQLARILLTQPELIILDEPDSSLDIDTKNILINFIVESHKLANSKLTWILVTHDLDIAVWISKNIYLVKTIDNTQVVIAINGYNRQTELKIAKQSQEFNKLVNSVKRELGIVY